MANARELAMAAAHKADAPKRAEEERQRRERKEYEAQIAMESTNFLAKAKRKIKRTLGVDASKWEAVESHPTWAILRDPEDDGGIWHNTGLTLMVTAWYCEKKPRHLEVFYTPYQGYMGRNHNGIEIGGTTKRWYGPRITDALSLGRAIQKHEEDDRRIYASMPDHLP